MRLVMNPDMVYQYPIWAVGMLLVGAAILGAVVLELCARRLLPIELRQQHNDVAAAIFSIIGVTYAVLLAFVAMLAWHQLVEVFLRHEGTRIRIESLKPFLEGRPFVVDDL